MILIIVDMCVDVFVYICTLTHIYTNSGTNVSLGNYTKWK